MTDGVLVETRGLAASRGGVTLAPTSVRLGAGRHAVVGSVRDGTALLLAALAGMARHRGEVLVRGERRTGRAVAWVPLDAELPDVLRVREVLSLARRLRGSRDGDLLEAFGLGALRDRQVRTLDPGEVRAVALAEALGSLAPLVLVEEPFVSMSPPAAAALASVRRKRTDACLVFSTASAADASRLADHYLLMERGKLAGPVETLPRAAGPAHVRVVVSEARAFVAELARHPEVAELELDEHGVTMVGPEEQGLAAAINAAVVAAGVDLLRMERL